MGIAACIYLLSQQCPSYYNLLPIIPLTYGILNFLFVVVVSERSLSSVVGIMFNGVMLFRAVVMPILLQLGDYTTSLTVNIEQNMPIAILLFSYEMICEYVLLIIMFKRHSNKYGKAIIQEIKPNYRYGRLVGLLIVVLAVCFILAPMAVTYYRTIFGITEYEYTGFDSRTIISTYATNFFSKFGLVTFRYIVNISRLVIPAIIISIMKKRNVREKYAFIVTLASVFVFDMLLVDDTIATSIVNALITIIFYNRLYSDPKRTKIYFVYAFVAVVAYFALRLTLTSGGSLYTNIFTKISNIAQAYFLGTRNIAAGLNLTTEGWDTLKYMVYEFLKGVPYATTIFGLDSTNISTLFNNANNWVGQIVPAISSGSLYFGKIFAPIYPLLFLYISFKASRDVEIKEKPLYVLSSITISVYALMGTSMYSPEATWSFLFCIGIPIKLLSNLFEKVKK